MAQVLLNPTGMKVLIADDSESVRFALRLVMEHFGHEVVGQASCASDLIELYRQLHPQVVLMDVRMPGMDGLSCTTQLALLDPNARVVIVTGGRTTAREAERAGAAGYIEKPFDLDELGRTVVAAAA